MTLATDTTYRCPGQLHSISRAVHLGRLSTFYDACRRCPHRDDMAGLPLRLRQRLAEAALVQPQSILQSEGIAGLYGDAIERSLVNRFAGAFGVWLRESGSQHDRPQVLLAGDDRPLTADLVAASGDGLRYAGCDVVDLGGATAACLAHEVAAAGAAGGMLIGNAAGQLRSASVSLWMAGGQPISGCLQGEPLQDIWTLANQPVARPGRRYGGWQRGDARERYLDRLGPYFHALRPLEFLLDTQCQPLKRLLDRLLQKVSCRLVTPGQWHEVQAERLHFRAWIDGNGECLKVADERGQPVSGEMLLCLLAQRLQSEQPSARVIVEESISPGALAWLRRTGLQVIPSTTSRAQMHQAMIESSGALGGGPSGRICFAGPAPAVDALEALSRLLVILSQSDRPLSQVLDGCRACQVE